MAWALVLAYLFFKTTIPTANFGQFSGEQPQHPQHFFTMFSIFWPEGHWEPHNKVGSLRLVKFLVEFELGTFWY